MKKNQVTALLYLLAPLLLASTFNFGCAGSGSGASDSSNPSSSESPLLESGAGGGLLPGSPQPGIVGLYSIEFPVSLELVGNILPRTARAGYGNSPSLPAVVSVVSFRDVPVAPSTCSFSNPQTGGQVSSLVMMDGSVLFLSAHGGTIAAECYGTPPFLITVSQDAVARSAEERLLFSFSPATAEDPFTKLQPQNQETADLVLSEGIILAFSEAQIGDDATERSFVLLTSTESGAFYFDTTILDRDLSSSTYFHLGMNLRTRTEEDLALEYFPTYSSIRSFTAGF